MTIRQATVDDWDAIWPIFEEVVKAGETYAFDPNIDKASARAAWLDIPRETYVFEESGEVLGTYYLKTNQSGYGNHVSNCGYMVSSAARGRGLATLLCEHSQHTALALGYLAMQFNFVVSSNAVAVKCWTKNGFEIVGRLPRAFRHPRLGLVDALVMYKWLETDS